LQGQRAEETQQNPAETLHANHFLVVMLLHWEHMGETDKSARVPHMENRPEEPYNIRKESKGRSNIPSSFFSRWKKLCCCRRLTSSTQRA
jgi:hypothetical protein